jgi:tetratricopeptide (TPR) repeat protein
MTESPAELLAACDGQLEFVREYAGGQGRTLAVRPRRGGPTLVLKVLPAGDEPVEASLLASLRHPGIPTVHRVGRLPDGRAFVVRDHVDGEALSSLPRTPEALQPVLQQLLEVLAYVHLRSVRHLDLKPANLVLDGSGRLHLLDFGLSVRGGDAGSGGTPFYAAPEVLLGSVPDHRADLFSVGAMVAQALTKRRVALARFVDAFPAQDFFTAAGIDLNELPPPFDRFVASCVERRPERRFPDAEAALELLFGGSGRPSPALLAPDPVALFGPELAAARSAAHDVVLRGGEAADRRAVALYLASTLPGVCAIDEAPEQLRLVRDGGAQVAIDLPPLDAARLHAQVEGVLGLDGTGRDRAAQWLIDAGGRTSSGVASVLQRLVQSGELLPSGSRWTWPAARSGRLRADEPPPGDDEPTPERIRAVAARGLVERARAMWLRTVEDVAKERAARAALAEGLLDAGEPAKALPLCAGSPVLHAHALLGTGHFALAARELASVEPIDSPRYRIVAAQLALASRRFERARDVLTRPSATVMEKAALAVVFEQSGDLPASELLLQQCSAELSPDAAPFACATAHTVHGHVARRRGDLTAAREHFQAASDLFHAMGHVRHVATEQLNLGVIAKDLGEHQEAVSRFREARSLYEHVGDRARAAVATANLGIAALARGDVGTAKPMLEQASSMLLELGDQSAGRLATVMLARACAESGDVNGAEQALATVGEPDSDRLRAEVAAVQECLRRLEQTGPSKRSSTSGPRPGQRSARTRICSSPSSATRSTCLVRIRRRAMKRGTRTFSKRMLCFPTKAER